MRLLSAFSIAIVLCFFCSCSGAGLHSIRTQTNNQQIAMLQADRTITGFQLRVLSDSCIDNSEISCVSLQLHESGEEVLVNIHVAGARGLKALYYELDYDADLYSPVGCTTTDVLAGKRQLLSLAQLDERGVVRHGQVVGRYPEVEGFSGDGVLANVRFKCSPFTGNKSASKVPDKDSSRPVLSGYDPFTDSGQQVSLAWSYVNPGDYDQNKEVNISDLTPLGRHLGDETTPSTVHLDGDGNGEININDITSIGANLGARVIGYHVYHSNSLLDWPTVNTGPNGAGATLVGDLLFDDGFEYQHSAMCAHTDENYFWVRPYDSDGNEGSPSYVGENWGPLPQGVTFRGTGIGVMESLMFDQTNITALYGVAEETGSNLRLHIYPMESRTMHGFEFEVSFDQGSLDPQVIELSPAIDSTGQLDGIEALGADGVRFIKRFTGEPANAQYKGTGRLASVTFLKQPSTRGVLPEKLESVWEEVTPVLSISGNQLSWHPGIPADTNSDGKVDLSDISMIGGYKGAVGPFDISQVQFDADANRDSIVSNNDVSSIYLFLGKAIGGYNVYCSTDPQDYPASAADESTLNRIGTYNMRDIFDLPDERPDPKPCLYDLISPEVGQYYWIRPVCEYSNIECPPSNMVQYTGE